MLRSLNPLMETVLVTRTAEQYCTGTGKGRTESFQKFRLPVFEGCQNRVNMLERMRKTVLCQLCVDCCKTGRSIFMQTGIITQVRVRL